MNIAVSACLLGETCRYDGVSKPCAAVHLLQESHTLIPVCPEVAGGLSTPRPSCEIATNESPLRVVSAEGVDMTESFIEGAKKTLLQVKCNECELVVLKTKSPSCGTGLVYDGSFTGTLVDGWGIAAQLIRSENIPIIDETQVDGYFSTDGAKSSRKEFYLYVLECSDGTWYTGYTVNVAERVKTHNQGAGAKYTRVRLPVRLLVQAKFSTKHEAMSAEYHFKRLSRKQKERLVERGQTKPFEAVLCETFPSLSSDEKNYSDSSFDGY